MDDNTAYLLLAFMLFGWIPIIAIGSVITSAMKAKRCNKCTCNNCKKEIKE